MAESPYAGFDLLPESETDGWLYGAITVFGDECLRDPDSQCPASGCVGGDGFVQAPDGSRAGIVWSVGAFEPFEQLPAGTDRWGVFEVPFPRPVADVDDLVVGFRAVLPYLRARHAARDVGRS